MDKELNIINGFDNMVIVEHISEDEYNIKTEATFLNGDPIITHLVKIDNEWYYSDKKSTLKYMNEKYELSAKDVKMCISAVLKLYGFKITGGVLLAKVKNQSVLQDKLYDIIMCISQLANMHAFFDDPNNK